MAPVTQSDPHIHVICINDIIIHPQKSTKYNICVPTISLTHPLYVMSRSVWLIPLVNLPDPNIYVIYTSTEVRIIQYVSLLYHWPIPSMSCQGQSDWFPGQSAWSQHLCHIYINRSPHYTIYVPLLYHWPIFSMSCQGQSDWFPGQSAWSPHLCHIYIHRSPHYTIYVSLLYHWPIPSMPCQGHSCWFPWSVCLIPTSMSYIHPQKSIKYNICAPTISLTHPLYAMSRSVWLIPWSVCLIPTYMSYIHPQKSIKYNICAPTISLTHPLYAMSRSVWLIPWSVCLIPKSMSYIHQQKSTKYNICVPTISLTHLLYVMSRSVWLIPWSVWLIPTYMSYIHQQKSTLYNICVPTISLTHLLYVMSRSVWLIPLVSLADPHIYVIYTSTEVHIYTIYVSLLYHWPIFSMSCQGQSDWFPWSVCLIPKSMSYIHSQKSIKYNICAPTISLTHPLYAMSRSVWLIPLVSLSDPHIYVIYTSTEVHIYTIYVPLLYHWPIFSMSCQGQSVWSPHTCHIYIHRSPSNTIYVSLLYHWPISSMPCQGQSGCFPWSVCLIPTSKSYIHQQKSTFIQYMCPYYIIDPSSLCHVKVSLTDSPGQFAWSPHLCHIYINRSPHLYNICAPTISLTHLLYVMSRSVWLIPLVSLADPHIYVIYTSTEVHQIQYMCPYYITDPSSLCHVKVSLTDSPGQSGWSPHLCHIYIHRSPSNTIYVPLLYHWHIPSMPCQGQSDWFPWSVCLIPTSMSYIHQQKSTFIQYMCPYYITDPSSLCHVKVSLSDPHIHVIYTSTEVHQIQYMCPYYITDQSPLCHVKVSLAVSPGQSVWSPHLSHIYINRSPHLYNICAPTISLTHLLYVMSRSVWLIPLVSLPNPHIYVIYTSTEVHQIQYMCPYYITDPSSLCHVKVSLTDSPGQSVWSPHLCHIYINRSPLNTIYLSLLYHWPIFSMSCQGHFGWFPLSVCLIPTSLSYIHPQKSTKYNICVPTISLTLPLYVMSRSLWLIPLVSLADPHIYVIYTSTEVHIIQYMCPYYITDPSSLFHVKVSLTDSPGQSVWSPHLCHIYINRSPHLYNICAPTISLTHPLYAMSRSVWLIPLVSLPDPHINLFK